MKKQTHTVILIHGIRTRAEWYSRIRGALEKDGIEVITPGYERFDLLSFLLPGPTRNRAVKGIERQVIDTFLNKSKNKKISIIAHSFGTYIVSEILENNPKIKPNKVIYCGSVASSKRNWAVITNNIEHGLINECGCRDVFPILAAGLTIGFSPTGTYGIQRGGVQDRFHKLRHSGFFSGENSIAVMDWPKLITGSGNINTNNHTNKKPNKSMFPFFFCFIDPMFIRIYLITILISVGVYFFESDVENIVQSCLWDCEARTMNIKSIFDYSFSHCDGKSKIKPKILVIHMTKFSKFVDKLHFNISLQKGSGPSGHQDAQFNDKAIFDLMNIARLDKSAFVEKGIEKTKTILPVFGRTARVAFMIKDAQGLLHGVGLRGKFPIKKADIEINLPVGLRYTNIPCNQSPHEIFKKNSKFDLCYRTDKGFTCSPKIDTNILVYCFKMSQDWCKIKF